MILGFKEVFKEKILNKSKIHTIREDKHNRWAAGKMINFATGVRTKNYNEFKCQDTCKSVEVIRIQWFEHLADSVNAPFLYKHEKRVARVFIGKKILTKPEVEILVMNDGFDSMDDFFAWFSKSFEGKIIHWTNYRYDATQTP